MERLGDDLMKGVALTLSQQLSMGKESCTRHSGIFKVQSSVYRYRDTVGFHCMFMWSEIRRGLTEV